MFWCCLACVLRLLGHFLRIVQGQCWPVAPPTLPSKDFQQNYSPVAIPVINSILVCQGQTDQGRGKSNNTPYGI